MKKAMLCLVAMVAMFVPTIRAQGVVGNWQGTLDLGGGKLRMVVKIAKDDRGGLSAKLYNADRGTQPASASSVTLKGSTFKFSVDMMGATYEGKLSADGNTITGTWTGGPIPTPLNFARATPETAWNIPEPPKPPKPMAADADPGFDVATIKPNASGAAGLQQLTMSGRNLKIVNGSLGELIAFAYNVQTKQIVNGPDWTDKARYDIAGVPDVEGEPNITQLRTMVRKLLVERFSLEVHNEKRDMPAFVLSVGKSGQKLMASESKSALPNIGERPAPNGLKLVAENATLAEFAGFLQMIVLDRPVVDQTGVEGRYDLSFTFTPDNSEFSGNPPRVPTLAEGTEPAPGLYDAIEQQLGMKLTQEKTAVDVIAIDHVDKPSAN